MRPWDLETSAAQLRDAMDELLLAWGRTTESWDDEVSQKYCENYLEPIGPTMKLTLDAVSRMQVLLNQMQQDCES